MSLSQQNHHLLQLKTHLLNLTSSLIRLPSLIIINELFRYQFGLGITIEKLNTFKLWIDFDMVEYEFGSDLIVFGMFLGGVVATFISTLLIFLPTAQLLNLYQQLILIIIFYLNYTTTPTLTTIIATTILTTALTPTSQLLPLHLILIYTPHLFPIPPAIYTILTITLKLNPIKIYSFLLQNWLETKRLRNEFGISHLIQVENQRLQFSYLFKLFWLSCAVIDIWFWEGRGGGEGEEEWWLSGVWRYVLVRGTETLPSIIGLTTLISYFANLIGELLLYILYYGSNTNESDQNRFGSISNVLFFILSLQTGITSLGESKRLDRLGKNVILLCTALFHAVHQMLTPVLHTYRTFQTIQLRAITISLLFILISITATYQLLQKTMLSTWSLAVFALLIEFNLKITISLIISAVIYSSQLLSWNWLKLIDNVSHEDVIFYLKSLANVIEFLTGIFLFCNAVWIFCFESASAIRLIGMSIHAYFNIYTEACKGLKIYKQRQTASIKIQSLQNATTTELNLKQDDVCAICYEEMLAAKITNCRHLFHSVCLRKWLYVQNTCPLCHQLIYDEEEVGRTTGRTTVGEVESNVVRGRVGEEGARQRRPHVGGEEGGGAGGGGGGLVVFL